MEAQFANSRTKIGIEKGNMVEVIHEFNMGSEDSKMSWKMGYDGK